MKKKAIPPFSLTAGQSGRLLFDFTLPEGAEKPALRGVLMVHGERVDMEGTQEDMLTIPALPAGVYLAEVRAAGVCVLYGHVEVLPSPLFGEEGLATYRVEVDNTTDVLQVNITMLEGKPGPKGESGHLQPVDPATPDNLTFEPGHILDLGTLTADTDLTALSFAESANVQTAELWFTTGVPAPVITWPADLVWAAPQPAISGATAYRFALRREPSGKLIINLAYEYSL